MKLKYPLLPAIALLFLLPLYSQNSTVTVSGIVKNKSDKQILPFVNVVLKKQKDSLFVTGTAGNEEGRFTIAGIPPGNYIIQFSYSGFAALNQNILVGSLSQFLDLGTIELQQDSGGLQTVTVIAKPDDISKHDYK